MNQKSEWMGGYYTIWSTGKMEVFNLKGKLKIAFMACCRKAKFTHDGCTCNGVTFCPTHKFRHNFSGDKHP
jgi:hypothetical protein